MTEYSHNKFKKDGTPKKLGDYPALTRLVKAEGGPNAYDNNRRYEGAVAAIEMLTPLVLNRIDHKINEMFQERELEKHTLRRIK